MPVKIRLARHGKKNKPFYFIVVADSRAPRDGRFIERIGSYNPNTNPAFIELEFDKALNWLQKGAQPTDTCRTILSHEGVLMKKHLLDGARKNAFTLEEAEVKFQKWVEDKKKAIEAKREKLTQLKSDEQQKLMAAESKVREERAEAIAKKNAKLAAKGKAVEESEPVAEEAADEEETSEVAEKVEIAAEATQDAETPEKPKEEEPVAEEPATDEPKAEEAEVEKPEEPEASKE